MDVHEFYIFRFSLSLLSEVAIDYFSVHNICTTINLNDEHYLHEERTMKLEYTHQAHQVFI